MRCGAQSPRRESRGDEWGSEGGKGIENAGGRKGWQLTSH